MKALSLVSAPTAFLLALLALSACRQEPASEEAKSTENTAAVCDRATGQEAKEMITKGAVLVDVRSPEEYNELHIEGAKNIPVDEVESRLSEFPKDKPIVLYCRSGRRSGKALTMLREKGYQAYNMGGMSAWNTTGKACP